MKNHSIALIAHDNKKKDLLDFVTKHKTIFKHQTLYATGTTGHLIEKELDLPIQCLQSGPLGGDQQIGAMIVERKIDMLIFFWDPLEAQPHDPDIRALLRIAVVWNIPIACNETTAKFLLSSNLF